MPSEIITLQFGHYSNCVGAHWWNLQETGFSYDQHGPLSEIAPDVLFREGRTLKGEVTFTPRLVCVDLAASASYVPALHTCCASSHQLHKSPITENSSALSPLWHQPLEIHRFDSPSQRSANSECAVRSDVNEKSCDSDEASASDDMRVWRDDGRVVYHQRSALHISQYQHNNAAQPFDLFGYGVDVYNHGKLRDEFEDRLRLYAEECDFLSGFHILADGDNGMSGVCCTALHHLCDEYTRTPVYTVPLYSPCATTRSVPQLVCAAVNTALSLDTMLTVSSLCSPLSLTTDWTSPRCTSPPHRKFPRLKFKYCSSYHTAAVIASALDTITLPWRLRDSSANQRFVGVASALTSISHSALACVSLSLPHISSPALPGSAGTAVLSDLHLTPITPAVPLVDWQRQHTAGVVVSRAVHNCSDILAALHTECPLVTSVNLDTAMSVRSPFPADIFTPSPLCAANAGSEPGVSVIGMLHSSSHVTGVSVGRLRDAVSTLDINKLRRHSDAGLETQEWQETVERLNSLAEAAVT